MWREQLLGCALQCSVCRRALVPGALFANGYRDYGTLCHACRKEQREEALTALEAELDALDGWGGYSTEAVEGRYGQ